MILLVKTINKLKAALDNQVTARDIQKYSIHIRLNDKILVYVVCENTAYTLPDVGYKTRIDCIIYQQKEYELGGIDTIFEEKIAWNNSRRRLREPIAQDKPEFACPVLTFYSYKGGMGRSTTLASYATHLAVNHGKRVFILDCDLEAPGFSNFFVEDARKAAYKDGLVEYLMNKSFTGEKQNVGDYIHKVASKYTGEGAIYIMQAGNTDPHLYDAEAADLSSYIEGLARLPLSQADVIAKQLSQVIQEVIADKNFQPDVVLIDSRTGFNDIFNATALLLSNCVLGFFGINTQSHAGVFHFLENIINLNEKRHAQGSEPLQILLANSIVPDHVLDKKAKEYYQNMLEMMLQKLEKSVHDLGITENFLIGYSKILANIGSPDEEFENFIALIQNKKFNPYQELFAGLDQQVLIS